MVRVDRGACEVVTAGGERTVPVEGLAVGDWVLVTVDGEGGGRLVAVLPRWSELARRRDERQVLAADVDLVLVTAPADRVSPARVERELVVAWDSGARPVVVVTKIDLAPPDLVADLADRLVGVEVIGTSGVTGAGLDRVRALLAAPATAVLLGPSGAGKSTLINALLGDDRLAVGPVRASDHRGRHTTSWRELQPIPTGGAVIDMPGLRELALDVDADAVDTAFDDIRALATSCRFADCAHDVEPGCAVTAAAAAGDLDEGRLASYRKLQREAAFEHRRRDRRARQAEERVWKQRSRAAREVSRRKQR